MLHNLLYTIGVLIFAWLTFPGLSPILNWYNEYQWLKREREKRERLAADALVKQEQEYKRQQEQEYKRQQEQYRQLERQERMGRGVTALQLIEEEREVKAELRRGTSVSEILKNLNARAPSPVRSPKIVVGPTKVSGGVVARAINEPNGSVSLEIWETGKGWVDGKGKVMPDELMPGAGKPVSASDAARLGIPASELDHLSGGVVSSH